MSTIIRTEPVSNARRWTGRIISALVVLFLIVDAGMKLLRVPLVVEGSAQLGFTEMDVVAIGAVLLACSALYVIPRTSLAGAVLLTGYLGGAIATHVRMDSPFFSHTFFPVYVAALVWAGLVLRQGWVVRTQAPARLA